MKYIMENSPEMINGDTVELMCHPNYEDGKLVNNIPVGFDELMPLLSEAEWSKW
jgi:hypothetical protein